MKKLFVILTVVLALAMVVQPVYAQGGKIGYIDARRVLYSYEKTKAYEKDMSGLQEKLQAEREEKIEAVRKMRDEVELLNGDAKTKKQIELEGKIADLNEFDRNSRQQLLTKQNDALRDLMGDINKVVEALGKKGGYDYILDSRGLIYKKEALDLTEQAIQQLNK